MPVKHDACSGNTTEFGGFEHYLFLGCSISSFSISQGWNEQETKLTVRLVEDECSSVKKYFGTELELKRLDGPDPGFLGNTHDLEGTPVYFRVENFEFSGIVQRWVQEDSTGSKPTYLVEVVDPRQILENAQIIINDYSGGVGLVYNVVNAFGYAESFGSNLCPLVSQKAPGLYIEGDHSIDGPVFGNAASSFGGANMNKNGMRWNDIKDATHILYSAVSSINNIWSPFGRLVFKAAAQEAGHGLMPIDTNAFYFLDLSELPDAPSYWRFNGTSISVIEAINKITEDAGFDYYIELVPVVSGGTVYKFIKVRTIDRQTTPSFTFIDDFIDNHSVISSSKGRELRNEITSALVIGGDKQSVYQAEQSFDPEGDGQPANAQADDMIVPYFGVDIDTGDAIIPYKDELGFWEFQIKTSTLAFGLQWFGLIPPPTIKINERELIAANGGRDAWISHVQFEKTDSFRFTNLDFNVRGLIDIVDLEDVINDNKGFPKDIIGDKSIWKGSVNSDTDGILDTIYEFISNIATEYYGRKFMVRVPFVCGVRDSESNDVILSNEPSEGGWTEVTPVIELAHPSVASDFFSLEDGRLGTFCRFERAYAIDTSDLSEDSFITSFVPDFASDEWDDLSTDEQELVLSKSKLWIKAEVESEYVYIDKSTLFSPRAVITLPNSITQGKNVLIKLSDGDIFSKSVSYAIQALVIAKQSILAGLKDLFQDPQGNPKNPQDVDEDDIETIRKMYRRVGGAQIKISRSVRALMPSAAAFGIKSNTLTYGPWSNPGPPGGTRVVREEGLVPWQFGSFSVLNLAGQATADEALTNMQAAEMGSVTVPGYPEIPIGAELQAASSGAPFSGGGKNLVENRALTTINIHNVGTYRTNIVAWSGAYGPNVSDIRVSVGEGNNQITTTYNMRTWTTKFGRFNKGNAERLKTIGLNAFELRKQLRFGNKIGEVRSQQVAGFIEQEEAKHRAAIKKAKQAKGGAGNKNAGNFNVAPGPVGSEVLVGEMQTWNDSKSYKRTAVAAESTAGAISETEGNFDSKAFMSWDGLIRPISLNGAGGLPQLVSTLGSRGGRFSRPTLPLISGSEDAGPSQLLPVPLFIDHLALQPFQNPSGRPFSSGSLLQQTKNIGHDIDVLGRGSGTGAGHISIPVQGQIDNGDYSTYDYADDYRALALRGPLLIHGWGYDIEGRPIPNEKDVSAENGVFQTSSQSTTVRYRDGWLRKPETWPVAPVDLRFDRQRYVWTIPQSDSLAWGTAQEGIGLNDNGKIKLTANGRTVFESNLHDASGNQLDGDPTISAENIINRAIFSGDPVMVYYDSRSNDWWVIDAKDCNPLTNIDDNDDSPLDIYTSVNRVECCTGDSAGVNLLSLNRKRIFFNSCGRIYNVQDLLPETIFSCDCPTETVTESDKALVLTDSEQDTSCAGSFAVQVTEAPNTWCSGETATFQCYISGIDQFSNFDNSEVTMLLLRDQALPGEFSVTINSITPTPFASEDESDGREGARVRWKFGPGDLDTGESINLTVKATLNTFFGGLMNYYNQLIGNSSVSCGDSSLPVNPLTHYQYSYQDDVSCPGTFGDVGNAMMFPNSGGNLSISDGFMTWKSRETGTEQLELTNPESGNYPEIILPTPSTGLGSGHSDGCLFFDGDTYLQDTDNPNINQPTTVAMVYNNGGTHGTLFDGYADKQSVSLESGTGKYVMFAGGTSEVSDDEAAEGTVALIAVFNSGTSVLYENGNVVMTGINPGVNGLFGLTLGADASGDNRFVGNICQIWIYDEEVSDVTSLNDALMTQFDIPTPTGSGTGGTGDGGDGPGSI